MPKQKRIERKLKKVKKTNGYITKLLTGGKSQLGPCTSLDELLNAILAQPDRAEFIVKTEMSYYSNMHKLEICLNCSTSDFALNGQ